MSAGLDSTPERPGATAHLQPASPLAWLADAAHERRCAGLERVLRPRKPGRSAALDLASNDYLGLARHDEVTAAAADAARTYGAGATGSRLVSGATVLHEQLEAELAAHFGAACCLVFSSGYLANLGAVTAVAGPDTLIVSDRQNHASLIDACRLSGARVAVAPHADPQAVDRLLARRTERRALVATDAVFSVTGRMAPLTELHEVARRHNAVLLVDEAHALGVVGPRGEGAAAHAGLAGAPDVILTTSLSKSMGSQGGAVLGPAELRQHLVSTARSFVFDTALAPPAAAAALQALRLCDKRRVGRLRIAAGALAAALGVPRTDAAVLSVPLGTPERAVRAQDNCRAQGVLVGCFRPPSVPPGGSCLRVTASAALTPLDIARAGRVVADAVARSR